MAEAVAAFALAGNVLQFVEFAKSLVSKSLDIHRDKNSSASDLEDLRNVVTDFQAASKHLQISGADRLALSSRHLEIVQISDVCSKRFAEILESLARFEVIGNKRKRDTVVAAFKVTWNKKEIEDLRRDTILLSGTIETTP
ncbi:P-loop containing nucleoside triphosphate hydrolase [Colletotrichum tofieldiae]|nr:P-loop containing nucleoside triphosphate hydrolase [Colletotrichum tofieldiae]GKT76871.1 P-loop containing nucleoside triphosphate hydrolase [Colletotrichum tofieldiae]GKT92684.1 P-loop containing nucleoside triphosphate hydrolase [Colletotrichum tofieldiae]